MQTKFCFFIDDSFFNDGIDINTIKNFKVLFEVARQLKADTYYSKSAFNKAINSIDDQYKKPKFKKEVIKFIDDFIGIDIHESSANKINIYFCKTSNLAKNEFCDAKQAWTFLNSKLPKRFFNNEYQKHGRKREDSKLIMAWKGESQLLTTDIESQNLLEEAVFDLRERANFHINFDLNNNTYILFPNENNALKNTFHAFHILKNERTKMIPTSIDKYFKNCLKSI